jgi:protein-S-isoprenylcysteine O-methyltransferase Ste14
VLAISRRSGDKASMSRDKSSTIFLWLTIIAGVALGVYLGIRGIGYISVRYHALAYLGLVMIVAGLTVRWMAILTLRRYFTVDVAIVNGHKIIRRGLYKHLRHPAYAGSLLSFLGLGIAFSNWLSTIIIFIPVLAVFLYRIDIEEKTLAQSFGKEYLDYCRSTSRLIPKIY